MEGEPQERPATADIEPYLQVGRVLTVHFNPARKDTPRYRSCLRGWHRGGFILLERPQVAGHPLELAAEKPCIVRFVADGMACGFSTTIIEGIVRARAPILACHWPRAVEIRPLRAHQRAHVVLPALYRYGNHAPIPVEIVDISAGGCQLATKTGLPSGSPGWLTFTLPNGVSIEGTEVFIRSAKPTGADAHTYGCAFGRMPPANKAHIERFTESTASSEEMSTADGLRVLIFEPHAVEGSTLVAELGRLHIRALAEPGLVDTLYRLRSARPTALLIRGDGCVPPLPELCRIVHETEGLVDLPIYAYGALSIDQAGAQAAGLAGVLPGKTEPGPVAAWLNEQLHVHGDEHERSTDSTATPT